MKLPDKVQTVVLPGVAENTQEPLQWRVEWTRVGDDKLLARMKAELARGELTAAETPVFQRQLRELLEALGADVTFGR